MESREGMALSKLLQKAIDPKVQKQGLRFAGWLMGDTCTL